jgi:hypothetical protein
MRFILTCLLTLLLVGCVTYMPYAWGETTVTEGIK